MAMRVAVRAQIVFCAVALVAVGACRSGSAEDTKMGTKPSGKLESNPNVYKLNSVMGEVLSEGKAVTGATITIAKTGESFSVQPSGFYVFVLDPEKLGARGHELKYSAPGYAVQRHFVMVPENNQTRLDVELVPEEK
jgi:hypothetical protein